MTSKLLRALVFAAAAGAAFLACEEETTTDDGFTPLPPQANSAPVILNRITILQDTLLTVGVAYERLVSYEDLNRNQLVTVTASSPLQVVGSSVTFTPADTGTWTVWVAVTDDSGASDMVTWTMRAERAIDKSKSNPRIEVIAIHPAQQVVHPKLLNKPLVGLLFKKLDTSLIEIKIHPAITGDFDLSFDTQIDTGDSVILACFADSLADTIFIRPPDPTAGPLAWPEPAALWTLSSVVCDDRGGHGVQWNYNTHATTKHDISDVYDRYVEP
jgi:hypothetical protein